MFQNGRHLSLNRQETSENETDLMFFLFFALSWRGHSFLTKISCAPLPRTPPAFSHKMRFWGFCDRNGLYRIDFLILFSSLLCYNPISPLIIVDFLIFSTGIDNFSQRSWELTSLTRTPLWRRAQLNVSLALPIQGHWVYASLLVAHVTVKKNKKQ